MNQEYDPNQQKPKSMVGVVLAAAFLLMGVAGVLLIGPSNVVTAVTGLIKTEKVAEPEAPSEPVVEEPRRPARKALEPKPPAPVTVAEAPPPPPVETKPAPPPPRVFNIRLGMPRRELLDTYGAPAMKATKIEGGHLLENYAYMSASKVQQMVVLKDGQVVQTTGN